MDSPNSGFFHGPSPPIRHPMPLQINLGNVTSFRSSILIEHHEVSMKKLFASRPVLYRRTRIAHIHARANFQPQNLHRLHRTALNRICCAFTKKNVPAQMVQTEEAADYILSPAPVQQKPENGWWQIAVAYLRTAQASRDRKRRACH